MKTSKSLNKAVKRIVRQTKFVASIYEITLKKAGLDMERYHLWINRGTSEHYYLLGPRGAILVSDIL